MREVEHRTRHDLSRDLQRLVRLKACRGAEPDGLSRPESRQLLRPDDLEAATLEYGKIGGGQSGT
jgi:hypothetical protein